MKNFPQVPHTWLSNFQWVSNSDNIYLPPFPNSQHWHICLTCAVLGHQASISSLRLSNWQMTLGRWRGYTWLGLSDLQYLDFWRRYCKSCPLCWALIHFIHFYGCRSLFFCFLYFFNAQLLRKWFSKIEVYDDEWNDFFYYYSYISSPHTSSVYQCVCVCELATTIYININNNFKRCKLKLAIELWPAS